jgi:hypothetical protein
MDIGGDGLEQDCHFGKWLVDPRCTKMLQYQLFKDEIETF